MPSYNTTNVNNCQKSNKVGGVIATVFKECRERLQVERRQSWLDAVIKKHQVK